MRGSSKGISLVIAKAVIGLLTRRRRSGRQIVDRRRGGSASGTEVRDGDGPHGARRDVQHRSCPRPCRHARWLSFTDSSSYPTTLVGVRAYSHSSRSRRLLTSTGSRPGTGDSSTRDRPTRPNARLATAHRVRTRTVPDSPTMMITAVTDHVFIDEGHVLDFTNKAFEFLDAISAGSMRRGPSHLVGTDRRTQAPRRGIRMASSRRPHRSCCASSTADLAAEAFRCDRVMPDRGLSTPRPRRARLGRCLSESPKSRRRARRGPRRWCDRRQQPARAVAYAAALRIVRFHTQNDHGDWNEVHHAFTAAQRAAPVDGAMRRPRAHARRLPVRSRARTSTAS